MRTNAGTRGCLPEPALGLGKGRSRALPFSLSRQYSLPMPTPTLLPAAPLAFPRTVPAQKIRPPKKNIPQTPVQRQHILARVRAYVAEHAPVPPMPTEELKVHADRLVAQLGCEPIYRDYIGVLLNNEMWREPLAAVPFERRLLLLPKCLRVEAKCPRAVR